MAGPVPFQELYPGIAGYSPPALHCAAGRCSFASRTVPGSPAVLLNTIPKSGTYLYARLLERLGAVNCGVHLSSHEYWDFRGIDVADVVAAPDDFKVQLPIERTARLVGEGQFAVGHVDHSQRASELLSDLVHIFCVRDLRDVLVSHMRFMLDPRRRVRPGGEWWEGRSGPELFAAYLRGPGEAYLRNRILPIARWRGARVDLILRFEAILGDQGWEIQRRCLERICDSAGLSPPDDALAVLNTEVIGAQTRTYSGARSSMAEFQSDDVLDLLEELGVNALNEDLGYER